MEFSADGRSLTVDGLECLERPEVTVSVLRWEEHRDSLPVARGPSILRARGRAVMPELAHRERGQDLARVRDLVHRVRADRQGRVAQRRPAKLRVRSAPLHGDVAEGLSIPRRRKAQ